MPSRIEDSGRVYDLYWFIKLSSIVRTSAPFGVNILSGSGASIGKRVFGLADSWPGKSSGVAKGSGCCPA